MSLTSDSTIVWEVQTGGDDTNGGGYSSDDGGTDYSQQTSAILSKNDLACTTGTTTLTSSTGGFTAAMVDNVIQISSGTNFTPGFYRITAYTNSTTVTLNEDPTNGSDASSGVGKVGGCLATPGKAAKAADGNGQKIWVKSGTYTITTSTAGAAGPIEFLAAIVTMEGYQTTRGDRGTRPSVNAGAYSVTLFSSLGTSTDPVTVINMEADCNDNASSYGFYDSYLHTIGCKAIDCSRGFWNGKHFGDIAESCEYGFYTGHAYCCEALDCTNWGFYNMYAARCLASGCQKGFRVYSRMASSCTAYDSTSHGFDLAKYNYEACNNCLSVNSGGYGFYLKDGSTLINCAGYNPGGSGNYNSVTGSIIENFKVLTGDPFVDAASDDFRPDDTSGEGAELRAASASIPSQDTNWNLDIGAVQHSDPTGGGGGGSCHVIGG